MNEFFEPFLVQTLEAGDLHEQGTLGVHRSQQQLSRRTIKPITEVEENQSKLTKDEVWSAMKKNNRWSMKILMIAADCKK